MFDTDRYDFQCWHIIVISCIFCYLAKQCGDMPHILCALFTNVFMDQKSLYDSKIVSTSSHRSVVMKRHCFVCPNEPHDNKSRSSRLQKLHHVKNLFPVMVLSDICILLVF